jgi:hypothetical protein
VLSELAVRDAVVPEVWAFEIANIIFVSFTRRKRITEQQIEEYLGRLKALPIRVEAKRSVGECRAGVSGAEEESCRIRHRLPDLALRKNLPLATADANLAAAALAEGVEIFR